LASFVSRRGAGTTLSPARPGRSSLARNLSLDLTTAVGVGSTMAVVGVLLPSIARRQGLDPMGLALLAALPFLASLVTLFAGRVGPRLPSRVARLRALGALSLLLVVVAPNPLLIALTVFFFWMAFALGSPLQQRIWATVYPSRDRGRLLGYVGTARSVAGTLSLLAITALAGVSGWGLIIVVIAVGGALLSLAMGRMEVPGIEVVQRYSAAGSVRLVFSLPMIRRITAAQLLFGAGLLAAPAFIAMVYVDRLGLSVDDIALAGLVSYGANAATVGLWGRLAGRSGAISTIGAGTILGTAAVILFALAPEFSVVLLATAALGAAGGAIDASWPLLMADHAPAERQSEVAAGMNAIMGLRGLIVPFVVMVPIAIGLTDETGGLAMCATAMSAGSLLYAHMSGLDLRVAGLVRRGFAIGLAGLAYGRVGLGYLRRSAVRVGAGLSSTHGWVRAQRRPASAAISDSSTSG